jgi:tellurite resistance protein
LFEVAVLFGRKQPSAELQTMYNWLKAQPNLDDSHRAALQELSQVLSAVGGDESADIETITATALNMLTQAQTPG